MISLSVTVPSTAQPPTLAVCESAIAVSQEPPEELVIIRDPSFGGPAPARNLGAQQDTGDVLVFVDVDVEVHSDAFSLIGDLKILTRTIPQSCGPRTRTR
jgi:glycosyl transferase family 2